MQVKNEIKKGYMYLAQGGTRWYVVQQIGQRSWSATVFTHVADNMGSSSYGHIANAPNMTTWLHEQGAGDFYAFDSNPKMREVMFNILKTGDIYGQPQT